MSRVAASLFGLLAVIGNPIHAQFKSQAEEIRDLKKELKDLKGRVKELEEAQPQEEPAPKDATKAREDEALFAGGVLTLGGIRLRLGGKAEILLIDTQNERDLIAGATDSPDPHLELNRLRLEPTLLFNKEISLHSQIDFKPELGRVILKEMTARHGIDPTWWFRSDFRLGLDDRFIRPARRTKNYPLVGNAFWRDESVAFTWMLRFGDKDGPPELQGKKGGAGSAEDERAGVEARTIEGEAVDLDAGARRAPRRAAPSPFDFSKNLGEVRPYFSFGNGNTLNNNEVGFDNAALNDLVQDDRDFQNTLSLRELGFGLGYRRNFSWLGEVEWLGFYYDDELNDGSLTFLQQDLTVRNPVTGTPTAGYGNSTSRRSYRYGGGVEYFLPADVYMGPDWKQRPADGVRLAGQWIVGRDGDLRRDGWYAQASYRFSFPTRLIADRYIRGIEPLVRYGELNVNLSPTADLPGTWDRRQLLLGLDLEVLRWFHVLTEYSFNFERTGGEGSGRGPGAVSNNELLVELLLTF